MKKSIFICTITLVSLVLSATPRSHHWPHVRKEFLKTHPTCAVCGSPSDLQVHHSKPYHLYPELELDLSNLMTLCESKNWGFNCHFAVGHGGNFKWENPWVVQHAQKLKQLGSTKGCFNNPVCVQELNDYLNEIHKKVKKYNRNKRKRRIIRVE